MTICFLILMLGHEIGLAWYVRKYSHSLIEIKLFPIHGHCLYHYNNRYEPESMIYAGGLIAQLVIFSAWLGFALTLEYFGLWQVLSFIKPASDVFIQINAFIFVLNALPIPGLDGFVLWKRLYKCFMESITRLRIVKQKSKPKRVGTTEIVNLAIEKAKRKRK